jgi:hypothetical protein
MTKGKTRRGESSEERRERERDKETDRERERERERERGETGEFTTHYQKGAIFSRVSGGIMNEVETRGFSS